MKLELIKKSYKKMLKEIFNFKGKSTRTEYFIPVMIHILTYGILYGLVHVLNIEDNSMFFYIFILFSIYSFVTIFPLTFRRLHDAGYRAVILIAVIIVSFLIVFLSIHFALNVLVWFFTIGTTKLYAGFYTTAFSILYLADAILGVILFLRLIRPSRE